MGRWGWGGGKSGKYRKGSEHRSVRAALAAATEEQWEPTPHTAHTSTEAGVCDGESAAYETFSKKKKRSLVSSGKAQVLSCMQMAIARGGGPSFPQPGVSFDCPDFGELASKLEDASLPGLEVYVVCMRVPSIVLCNYSRGRWDPGSGSRIMNRWLSCLSTLKAGSWETWQ